MTAGPRPALGTPAPVPAGRRAQAALALLLTGIVLLAPLPAGSNRPVPWLAWTLVLSLVLLVWLARGGRLAASRGPGLRWPLLLGVATLLAALCQALPFAGLLPARLLALPETGAGAPATISLLPGATLLGVLRGAGYLIFLVLMAEAARRRDLARPVARAIFWGCVVHAVWGLAALNLMGDRHLWGPKEAYLGAATGAFINRNAFATFLAMALPLGLALLIDRGRSARMRAPHPAGFARPEALAAALGWLALGLLLLTVIATQSRMGLAAALAGLAVTAALMRPARPARSRRRGAPLRRAAPVLAGLGLLLAGAALLGGGVAERMVLVEEAALTRGALYAQVRGMILARPLAGYGLDAFPAAYELFHRAPVSADLVWGHSHSTYLALWAELGLLAGSLPLLAALLVALHLRRLVKVRIEDNALPAAALGALAAAAVHAIVDFGMEMQANMFLLLALLALGLARRMEPRDAVPVPGLRRVAAA